MFFNSWLGVGSGVYRQMEFGLLLCLDRMIFLKNMLVWVASCTTRDNRIILLREIMERTSMNFIVDFLLVYNYTQI